MQMESTYGLYNLMNKGQYLLCYSGYLAQNQVTSLLALAERKMQKEVTEIQVRRKVFSVMIECLQSFCTNKSDGNSNIFVLGKGESFYEVLSSFNCDHEFAKRMATFIEELDTFDKEKIREVHRKMLVEEFEHPSMASFYSLLDIAMKSESPIEYDFTAHSSYCVFTIRTVIPF